MKWVILSVLFVSTVSAAIFEEGRLFQKQGCEAFLNGQYREAVEFFDRAIVLHPDDVYLYSMRNFCGGDRVESGLIETEELKEILFSYGNNDACLTPFQYAVRIGDLDAVALMVKHGADLNGKQRVCYPQSVNGLIGHIAWPTPLHQAVLSNQLEVVRFLLEQGADSQLDDGGLTPLMLARKMGRSKMINLLKDR